MLLALYGIKNNDNNNDIKRIWIEFVCFEFVFCERSTSSDIFISFWNFCSGQVCVPCYGTMCVYVCVE